MGNVHIAGPNELLVVTQGESRKYVIGDWAWVSCSSKAEKLSMEVMSLRSVVRKVETIEGPPVTMTIMWNVKVFNEKAFLGWACDQFLGKSQEEMERIILETLEVTLIDAIGKFSTEAIQTDKRGLSQVVRELASPKAARIGIELYTAIMESVQEHAENEN